MYWWSLRSLCIKSCIIFCKTIRFVTMHVLLFHYFLSNVEAKVVVTMKLYCYNIIISLFQVPRTVCQDLPADAGLYPGATQQGRHPWLSAIHDS